MKNRLNLDFPDLNYEENATDIAMIDKINSLTNFKESRTEIIYEKVDKIIIEKLR